MIAILLLFSSCEDLFESASVPEHFRAAQGFYTNSNEINLGVVGCYNGLQDAMNTEFFLTEVRSDNAKTTTVSTFESVELIYRLDGFLPESSNPYIQTYWETTYANIQNTNLVLEHLEVVKDLELRNHFEGELRFLRAYHYFNLIRLFGAVPVYLEGTKIADLPDYFEKTRMSVDLVYDIIISDLLFSSENLKEGPHDDNIGRVHEWSAKALLGRVLLTQGDFVNARIHLEDVYLNSGVVLAPDYTTVFTDEHHEEILFSVRYATNSGNIGSPFANYFAPSRSDNNIVKGDGRGYNYPTDDLIEIFGSDPRGLGVTFETEFINTVGNVVDQYIGGAYCKKYLSQPDLVNDAENDFPVIRFSDVILMLSEVVNEMEGPAAAVGYLNEVRLRAQVLPITETTSREDFKTLLLLERRMEFAFENLRWFDLMRFGRAEAIMTEHFSNDSTDSEYLEDPNNLGKSLVQTILPLQTDRLLLPLPEKEIKANPNLTQNNYN